MRLDRKVAIGWLVYADPGVCSIQIERQTGILDSIVLDRSAEPAIRPQDCGQALLEWICVEKYDPSSSLFTNIAPIKRWDLVHFRQLWIIDRYCCQIGNTRVLSDNQIADDISPKILCLKIKGKNCTFLLKIEEKHKEENFPSRVLHGNCQMVSPAGHHH